MKNKDNFEPSEKTGYSEEWSREVSSCIDFYAVLGRDCAVCLSRCSL